MSTIKADNVQTLAGASAPMADVVNGSARAWVNFGGTGTVAIRKAYNVTSITDNGVGDYTVNFTSPMPDANYCTVFGQRLDNTGATGAGVPGGSLARDTATQATSSVRVKGISLASSVFVNADIETANVVIFD